MYTLNITKQPQRFLRKASYDLRTRCINKLRELEQNPFPKDVKRVMGKANKVFRIRVGDHRIQYEVMQEENTIVVTKLEKRPKAYQ